jgi:hypothetical protein
MFNVWNLAAFASFFWVYVDVPIEFWVGLIGFQRMQTALADER